MVPALLLDLALLLVAFLTPLLTFSTSPYVALTLVSGLFVVAVLWGWRRGCAPVPAPLPEVFPGVWVLILAGLAVCHLLPWFSLPAPVALWWEQYLYQTGHFASIHPELTLVWALSLVGALFLFLMARDRLRDIPRRHRFLMVMLGAGLLAALSPGEGQLLAGGSALGLLLLGVEGRLRGDPTLSWDEPLGPEFPPIGPILLAGVLGVLLVGAGGGLGFLPFWGVGLLVGLSQLSSSRLWRRLGLLLPLVCLVAFPPELPPSLLGWGPGVEGDLLWQGLNFPPPRGIWSLMGGLGVPGAAFTLLLYGLFLLPFWRQHLPPRPTTWGIPALMGVGATVVAAGFRGDLNLGTSTLLTLAMVAGVSLAALREEGGAPFEPSLIWGSLPRHMYLVLVGLLFPLGLMVALAAMKLTLSHLSFPHLTRADEPTLEKVLQFWPWSEEAAEGLARLDVDGSGGCRGRGVDLLQQLAPTSALSLHLGSSLLLCQGEREKSAQLVDLAARLYPQNVEVQVARVSLGFRTTPGEGLKRLGQVWESGDPEFRTEVVGSLCSQGVAAFTEVPSPPVPGELALVLWRCSTREEYGRCPLIEPSLKAEVLTPEDLVSMWELPGCNPEVRQQILDVWRRMEPSSEEVLQRQLDLWLQTGQVDRVRQQVMTLMEEKPLNRRWLALGVEVSLTSGVPPGWVSSLEVELGRDPSWVEGWEAQAHLSAQVGNRGARRAAVEQLVALRPAEVRYQVEMAEVDAEFGLDKRVEERLKSCISQLMPPSPCVLALALHYVHLGQMEPMSHLLETGLMSPGDQAIFEAKACQPAGPLSCPR